MRCLGCFLLRRLSLSLRQLPLAAAHVRAAVEEARRGEEQHGLLGLLEGGLELGEEERLRTDVAQRHEQGFLLVGGGGGCGGGGGRARVGGRGGGGGGGGEAKQAADAAAEGGGVCRLRLR